MHRSAACGPQTTERAISAFWIIGIVVNVALAVAVVWYVFRNIGPRDRD